MVPAREWPKVGWLWLVVSLLVPSAALGEELVPTISPADLYEQRKTGSGPLVIDVRTPAEFRSGHIPGALNIPHTELASRVDEVRSDRAVVLYCMVGPRARLGEKTLLEAKVPKVLHLEGGLAAWRDRGLPLIGPDAE